ncbi:MAG: hypothetical protein IJM59_00335 [Proteobacteria bacterium]|nr:hypothetical protein [Pseudomonadota bacterium]
MRVKICPECKDIIQEGSLRGTHSWCSACAKRQNASDLVEWDTEQIPTNSQGTQQYQRDMPMQRSQIRSLNELALPFGFTWLHENASENAWTAPSRDTLVYKKKGFPFALLFGGIWAFVGIFMLIIFVSIYQSGDVSSFTINGRPATSTSQMLPFLFIPLPFAIIGSIILIFGIRQVLAKTWIQISRDTVLIEHSMKRRGRGKVFARDPQQTKIEVSVCGSINRQPAYRVLVWDANQKITVDSMLNETKANEISTLLQTILYADL